jgi:hypothetical protein
MAIAIWQEYKPMLWWVSNIIILIGISCYTYFQQQACYYIQEVVVELFILIAVMNPRFLGTTLIRSVAIGHNHEDISSTPQHFPSLKLSVFFIRRTPARRSNHCCFGNFPRAVNGLRPYPRWCRPHDRRCGTQLARKATATRIP